MGQPIGQQNIPAWLGSLRRYLGQLAFQSSVSGQQIESKSVGTAHIVDAAIATAKIATAAVGTAQIADAAIATAKIADLAVGTLKIGDLAITTGKIADGAVATAKIANAAVGTAQVSPLAINRIGITTNTASQPVTITAVTGTVPPSAPTTWTSVASVPLTIGSTADFIRLQALVTQSVTHFFLNAHQAAITGAGAVTIVNDQIWARVRETVTNTVIWQTTFGEAVKDQWQAGTNLAVGVNGVAVALSGPLSGIPGSILTSGLSGALTFVLEIGATDMVSQYSAALALTVTVTSAYLEVWDIQR